MAIPINRRADETYADIDHLDLHLLARRGRPTAPLELEALAARRPVAHDGEPVRELLGDGDGRVRVAEISRAFILFSPATRRLVCLR